MFLQNNELVCTALCSCGELYDNCMNTEVAEVLHSLDSEIDDEHVERITILAWWNILCWVNSV